MADSKNVLIKFLAGLQTGAELTLAPGEYVLGADESADLVLMDAAVHPRHARLTVTSRDVSIEPIEGAPVTIDGREIDGAATLGDYDVVGLGGVYLAVGPDTLWPELPKIPQPKPTDKEPELQVREDGTETGGESAVEPESSAPSDSSPLSGNDSESTEDTGGKESTPPLRTKRRLLAAILALALLSGIIGGGVYAVSSLFKLSPGEKLARSIADSGIYAIYPAPADPELLSPNQIGLADKANGGFVLQGLVKDAAAGQAVRSLPTLSGIDVSDRLELADEKTERVGKELREQFPWAELKPASNGFYATLSGLAPKTDEVNQAYRFARTGLDNRIGIRRMVTDWADLRRTTESQAARLGVSEPRLSLKNGEVSFSASSQLSPHQKEDLIAYVDSEYGQSIALLFENALAKMPEPKPREVRPPVLPEYLAALSPLPRIQPAAVPEPEPAPEPVPEPVPEAIPASEPEPVPEPAPEPVPAPAKKPLSPPVKRWRIQWITPEGFVDQHGKHHKAGDYLSSNLRLVNSWENGVVFQRGAETLFGGTGSIIADSIPQMSSTNPTTEPLP